MTRRASQAAEGAIRRLSCQLADAREIGGHLGEPGVRDRLVAAAPALAHLCRGLRVSGDARLRRNVA